MKLNNKHVFLIFLITALLSTIFFQVKETMEVKQNNIPQRDENLYILKSQAVPPVCPKCPDSKVCPRQKPCQPCPPCERCPEPAFTCKKVPNYESTNKGYLPLPRLNTFSSFE